MIELPIGETCTRGVAAQNSAERTGRVKALREAADWFLKDDDEGGPSYTAPDGHAYYEAEFWAAAHLRALADREEA